MKALFTYALILSLSLVAAQRLPIKIKVDSVIYEQKQDSIFSILDVEKMAIFPGCNTSPEDKMACVKCFSDKLNNELIKYLDTTYPNTTIPKPSVKVQMQFVSDVEGYITQIEAIGGDPEYYSQAINALQSVSLNMEQAEMRIEPAELKDGTKVSIIYHNKIGLQNHFYKRDVVIYLHRQDCNTDEIYQRLPEWDIHNISKEIIDKWTKRGKPK